MRITVDPNTVATGFDYAPAGQYILKVEKVEIKTKPGGQYPYIQWTLAFADPNVKGVKGGKPGNIFEITTLKPGENAQFRLRQICEALGLEWGDFDTDDTLNMQLTAHVAIKEYQGKFSNEVDTFVPVNK